MRKLQNIGDSVETKRLIIPGHVEIKGRCEAAVQRVKSALNGDMLSRIERMITGLMYMREVSRLSSLVVETTQVTEFLAQNTVKLTKELFQQIPAVSTRDVSGLFVRTASAAGINLSLLRGLSVFTPGPDQKEVLLQMFAYHGALIIFHENVAHVFTLSKETFKHQRSFGASGGSGMDPNAHDWMLNVVFGALWYAQNVGVVAGLPKCTKPIDNSGTQTGRYNPDREPTNNWVRTHTRGDHYRLVKGERKLIRGYVAGGNKADTHTILDVMRKVRPAGSVALAHGGK